MIGHTPAVKNELKWCKSESLQPIELLVFVEGFKIWLKSRTRQDINARHGVHATNGRDSMGQTRNCYYVWHSGNALVWE